MALDIEPCAGVYAPAEDSEMLATAAATLAYGRVLDLGCGTGLAGITAATRREVTDVVFCDVNPVALDCAKKNAKRNGTKQPTTFVESNLFTNLRGQVFDTIMFNPPYLPTAEDEKLNGEYNKAFDGGPTGRNTTDRFIKQVGAHLAKGGLALLVSSSLASSKMDGKGNEETKALLEQQGFVVEKLAEQSFFFERLALFTARRKA